MTHCEPNLLTRRQLLGQVLGTGLCLPFAEVLAAWDIQAQPTPSVNSAVAAFSLSAEDDQLLNDLEKASILFFWEQGSSNTGMVKDRCNVHTNNQGGAASIAATGFGLTALCIGEQRGFIPSADALERVFATLRFLWKKLPNLCRRIQSSELTEEPGVVLGEPANVLDPVPPHAEPLDPQAEREPGH